MNALGAPWEHVETHDMSESIFSCIIYYTFIVLYRGSLAGIDLFEKTHYGHNKHMTCDIDVWKEQMHK